MRRGLLTVALVACVWSGTIAAHAGVAAGAHARVLGSSAQGWARAWSQWALGDASNPLFAGLLEGDCGEQMGRVFFMTAPIDLGVELDCDVPAGSWILVSHAGFFGTEGIDGETDAELEEAADSGFTTVTNELTLDGRPLPLRTTHTGAFDVMSEAGGFYDAILEIGTGPIRTAVTGNFTLLAPLPPGDHTLEGEVEFTNGEHYSVTYHVHVG